MINSITKKRLLSLLLCVTMIFCLVACNSEKEEDEDDAGSSEGLGILQQYGDGKDDGKDEDKDEDKNDEPITLTVYSQLANMSGNQEGWMAKILLDKFNVILNIIPEDNAVYESRVEAGNIGDIVVWGSAGNDYINAVNNELLYDWNENELLQKHGEYIAKNMVDALEYNQKLTESITDGDRDTLYGFGHNVAANVEEYESFFYTWDIRWDLYRELGYPEVDTLGDLVDVFKDMKKICPKDINGNPTYAVSLWSDWDSDMVMYVKSLASAYYGYDELGLGLYDPETGDFYAALEENGPYLECLKFFNELYQNGLLDPNSMTQTYDDMIEKLWADGVFFSIFNYSGSAGYNNNDKTEQNKMMCSLVPTNASPIVYGMSTIGGNRIWSIGAGTEHPELCMQIINWLCTPEGVMTYHYGPKELCWDYDEDGYAYLTEFGKKCMSDRNTVMTGDYAGTRTFKDGVLGINNTTWSINARNSEGNDERYNCDYWKNNQPEASCETEQNWRDYMGASSAQEYMEDTDYTVAYASKYELPQKSNAFKGTWMSVTDIILSYSWKAMYAEDDNEFNEIVSKMIQNAEKYGYYDCVEWSKEQAEIRYSMEEELK